MARDRRSEKKHQSAKRIGGGEEGEPLRKRKMEMEKKEAGAGEDIETFLEKMEEAASAITKISQNAETIGKLQRKLLTASRKSDADERRLEDLMAENKTLAKTIRNVLKEEQDKQAGWAAGKSGSPPAGELRMRRTQLTAQSHRFYDTWEQYNAGQAEYRDKSKELLVKRVRIANSALTDEEIEAMLDEGKTSVFGKSILEQEQAARQQLSELQDRHNEFLKLEKAIVEINDMFVEVHNLVAQQSEMVDTIFAQVMSAEADVEQGREQLGQAKRYKSKTRKCKIILAIVLVVVIIIVVLVLLSNFGLI